MKATSYYGYYKADASIWDFKIGIRRLLLRLSRLDDPMVIYIVAVSCRHIIGPFSWKNAKLTLAEVEDEKGTVIKISGKNAGFALLASGGFAVTTGLETEFGTSLDSFFKQDENE